eukprot:3543974-Amphidinium_carterae.1
MDFSQTFPIDSDGIEQSSAGLRKVRLIDGYSKHGQNLAAQATEKLNHGGLDELDSSRSKTRLVIDGVVVYTQSGLSHEGRSQDGRPEKCTQACSSRCTTLTSGMRCSTLI